MKYTALTIGPIIKSLALAQRTKELWAASYFFSFLMEQVIDEIKKIDENAIILPKVDKTKLTVKSAGIFPDRLILQSENGMFEDLEKAVNKAIEETAKQFNIYKVNVETLKKYLNTHIIEFEYTARAEKTKENIDNSIFQANDFLANCELQANYKANDSNFFLKMLQKIETAPIYKDEIFKGKKNFPSIIEISTKGLNTAGINFNENEKEEADIWKEIELKNKDELKQLHKYIAIVQADGDNIGAVIKNVAKEGNKIEIAKFSKALSDFSLEAATIIDKYGGTSVYVGGDDLLFFAPLENKDENIFNLIEDLDKEFKTKIIDEFKVEEKPSMSYGISISYYKFPMHEALKTAQNLLFGKAKNATNKNAIAFKVLKHSGQAFEAVLEKPLNEKFLNLLNEDKGLVINSLIYNFDKHKIILEKIISDKQSLENFFNNFYDEHEHNKSETKDFINKVRDLLFETYEKSGNDFDKTINQLYAQLRLIKFLNTKNDD